MAKSQRKDLTRGPIGPLLYRLTAPMVLGILSMVLFNAIDTFFVARLGTEELTALSFTFAPILIMFTLIQGIGVGATALIAKSMGEGNLEKAARETTDSLVLGLVIAVLFSALGFAFLEPLFTLLGASAEVMPYVLDYMSIWLVAICFVVIPFVGNSAIRAAGDVRTPTLIMLFAVGINALLDPLLIFGYGPFPELGIRGAAYATAISRALTLVLSLWVLYRREKLITLVLPSWATVVNCWKAILAIGLPAGLTRMMVPVANLVIYALLARVENPNAVAGYGVATRIETLGASVLFALSATMGPFAGQNFGRRYFGRILDAVNKSNFFSIAWGVTTALLIWVLARPLAYLFTDHEGVADVVVLYLSVVPITLGFQGAVQVVNTTLNTLNRPRTAAAIVALQMFGIYLPLAYLGAQTQGEQGVFVSIAFAYFLGGLLSMYVIRKVLNALWEKEKQRVAVEEQDGWS